MRLSDLRPHALVSAAAGWWIRNQDDPAEELVIGDDTSGTKPPAGLSSSTEIYRSLSPAFKAINFRADAIGQIPLRVVNRDGLPRPAHPLSVALATMDSMQVLRDTESDLLVYGRAYWQLGESNRITIEHVPASRVRNPLSAGGPYRVRNVLVPAERIVHFRKYTPTPSFSAGSSDEVSPLAVLLKSAQVAHWSRESNIVAQRAYASISRYIIGVSTRSSEDEDVMSDDDVQTLHDWLRGVKYASDDTDREKPLKADGNIAVRGAPSAVAIGGREDKQFVAVQTWMIQEASRTLGVPPPLLDDLSRATYSNISTIIQMWYRGPFSANLKFYENVLTRRFLGSSADLRVEFDTSEVEELQPDRKEISERVRAEYRDRIISLEEAREQLEYDPTPPPSLQANGTSGLQDSET